MPHAPSTRSGVEAPPPGARPRPGPRQDRRCSPGSARPSENMHGDEREQSQRVGPRPDEVMLVGVLGRPSPARIEHDHLAAALADPADPSAHVGSREEAAVRDERVGAPDHQVVGVVDVRHRDRRPVAEHVARREVLRHLVDRRSRIDVLRAERSQEHLEVDHRREVVRVGIARRRRPPRRGRAQQRIGASPASTAANASLPGGLAQLAVLSYQRRTQPIGVLAELLEPERLGADEAGGEHVFGVASDRLDLARPP